MDSDARGGGLETNALTTRLYDDLKRLARQHLRAERPDVSLRPTDLVHEAYLKLSRIDRVAWRGKTHFLAVAAVQMRRVLVEHARAAGRAKRGHRPTLLTLDPQTLPVEREVVDILAVDEALERLARRDARRAHVAELRLFADLRIEEIAEAIGVSPRTVGDDWRLARAWLSRALGSAGARDS